MELSAETLGDEVLEAVGGAEQTAGLAAHLLAGAALLAQMAVVTAFQLSQRGEDVQTLLMIAAFCVINGLVSAMLAQRVCGLILHNTMHTKGVRDLVRKTGVPTIETGNLPDEPLDMAVSYSNFEAARTMTAHLGRLGYRKIGFVTLPVRDNDRSQERRRALQVPGVQRS